MLARILPFSVTRPESTIFRYSQSFYPFPVLVRTIFRYSHGFYLFPVLNQILLFLGTHIDSTIFLLSPGQIFDTRPDSTFSPYSPGFYYFSVLTLIRPFYGILQDHFSILAWILTLPRTCQDSIIFW